MKLPLTLVLGLAAAQIAVACGGTPAESPSSATSPTFDARATVTTITGAVTGLVGSCPALMFALERRIIKTDVATNFGDSKCTELRNSIRVEVTGAVQAEGSVLATRIRLVPAANAPTPPPSPTPRPSPTPALVSVVGVIDGLVGSCPTVSFSIERRLFKTVASTVFAGAGCSALVNGLRVELAGMVQSDGSISVVRLAVAPRPAAPPPVSPPPTPTTGVLAGAIGELTGTCPLMRITISGRTVTTTASTIFDGKRCAELTTGAFVEISFAMTATNAGLVALKVVSRR